MQWSPTEKLSPAQTVQRARANSDFIRSLIAAREAGVQARGLRALRPDEIKTLQSLHNAAEDWATVWVATNFNPSRVVGSYFAGEVHLGAFHEKVKIENGVSIGSGVYNCDLQNVRVGDNALVSNTSLIANYSIGAGAVVQGCGSIVCSAETAFGNGQSLSLGIEGHGRDTPIYAEINVEIASKIAANRRNVEELGAYAQAVAEYTRIATSALGVIGEKACVKNVPKILNVYVGPHTTIDSATWIENSTILSSEAEPTTIASGAYLKSAIIQWGARVESHAIVESAVLCEHSFADSHAKVINSLIGPNSGVSSGECNHSLVGPFVGFHHQSLLIAAYWPDGKGNVGFGANIGSNHTSKAPDQEIWPGEGVFFGLGVNIKFPADFSKAPYSILATGISTLPQRCEMPFSLITVRAEMIDGISPAYNEILPGWVLSDNIYTVRRNERKYATRNKATHSQFGFEVFRPEIVDLMVKARTALQKVEHVLTPARAVAMKSKGTAVIQAGMAYTDKDIPGLGKNFMKETARLEGINAYTFFIRFYALKGLHIAVKFCLRQGMDPLKALDAGHISDPRWEHERELLLQEFPNGGVKDLLNEYVTAFEKMAADTLLSKEKDDFRGVRIIPDYGTVHIHAKEDPFVKATLQESEELKFEVSGMMRRL